MLNARGKPFVYPKTERVVLENTRGGQMDGIAIHSVRSPGFAYSGHEIIFSHKGQNFTLRDETIGPDSYMRGVMIAIREVLRNQKLIHGWAPWTFPSV